MRRKERCQLSQSKPREIHLHTARHAVGEVETPAGNRLTGREANYSTAPPEDVARGMLMKNRAPLSKAT